MTNRAASIVTVIMLSVFGLFFLTVGSVGIALEFKSPPAQTMHLALFSFLILVGASIFPGVGTVVLTKLGVLSHLALPYAGYGRREAAGEVDLTPEDPKEIK